MVDLTVPNPPPTETVAPPIDPVADRFAGVDTWVFDLDNTLYPAHTNLFAQIDDRIREYVALVLDTSLADAQRVQKDFYHRYGTSLRGLMVEYGMSPDGFLEFVHDIDHTVVAPDPALGAEIARLPGRKFIMTNGTAKHAVKVARRLGVLDHFEDVFDIVAADLVPKPNRETYERFLDKHDIDPTRSAMFEDLSKNLVVPAALGMRTVLILPSGTREVFRDAWELEGRDAPHVDFVTEDLGAFLARLR